MSTIPKIIKFPTFDKPAVFENNQWFLLGITSLGTYESVGGHQDWDHGRKFF